MRSPRLSISSIALGGLFVIPPTPPHRDLTMSDYDRAAKMLAANTDSLMIGGRVRATWLTDDRFYYRTSTADGFEWVLVDPAHRTQKPLFDAPAVASALARAGAGTFDAKRIPATRAQLAIAGTEVVLEIKDHLWRCDVAGHACLADTAKTRPVPEVLSPDGKRAVFIRNWNLWARDVATNQETQLTTDGSENFGYATDNAGWVHSDRPIVLWSPDSRKIATQQQDERHVGDMYLVETRVGHPKLQAWKYPLPGDSVVAMISRVIIDVDRGTVVRLQTPPDYHRAMLGDNLSMADLIWSPDGARLAYVSTDRDHKSATVKIADATTGAVRTLFDEHASTQFESVAGWRILWPEKTLIWSSERSDWSELYAYNLETGALLHPITTGDGPVTGIPHADEKHRTLLVEARGREANEDPYFRHYYSVDVDGHHWTALTPESGDHSIQVAPDGQYFIDSYSSPTTPPIVVLREARTGRVVMPITRGDITRLIATGWKPPMPIVTTAHDGHTKLYGLLYRPTNFDSTQHYPIINNVYPGPQGGSVGSRSFVTAHGDCQALAELGFVVVQIDGMGNPFRSKRFHDAYYGAMGRDNTLPDQVASMRELATRYAWIDTTRVGVWGHSGGGFATADAMFRYPDFFKVGIAESGNHDQREYEDDWGERYQGLLTTTGKSDNYDPEANQTLAQNLKGHLLLAHGSLDDNVPPYNTMLVARALIEANKEFDELIIPNVHHGYASASLYMMRRRWDYFVRYLLNAEPPKDYRIAAGS